MLRTPDEYINTYSLTLTLTLSISLLMTAVGQFSILIQQNRGQTWDGTDISVGDVPAELVAWLVVVICVLLTVVNSSFPATD